MQRHIIGAATILFLLAGALLTWGPWGVAGDAWGPPVMRGGIALAVLWLGWNELERLPKWLVVGIPIMLLVAAYRPRTLLIALGLFAAWMVLRPRGKQKKHKPVRPQGTA